MGKLPRGAQRIRVNQPGSMRRVKRGAIHRPDRPYTPLWAPYYLEYREVSTTRVALLARLASLRAPSANFRLSIVP